MRIAAWAILALALVLTACQKKDSDSGSHPKVSATGNPITAPVDYLGAVAKAKNVATKTVDLTALHQAIQLFYAQEDRFPKDLDELVAQHYVAAIPQAPPGFVWTYNPKTGEIRPVRPR